MPSLSIQFHATLAEIASFTRVCIEKYGAIAVAVRTPFKVETLTTRNTSEVLGHEDVCTVMFTVNQADVSVTTANELLDRNEGCLLLDIGRLRGRCLEESCLNSMSVNPVWKKIAAELKRSTTAGALGTHERTGAIARYPNHRFTPGSVALISEGFVLKQYAQLPVSLQPLPARENNVQS